MKNIKNINYFYYSDNKKYTITDKNDRNITKNLNTNVTNINVSSDKFTENEAILEHTNAKWFINLTDTEILQNVSNLL